MHRFADRTEKAISHAIRILADTEEDTGKFEKEGIVLVYAIQKFHRYLFKQHFTRSAFPHKPQASSSFLEAKIDH